jgi:hypothetical protein
MRPRHPFIPGVLKNGIVNHWSSEGIEANTAACVQEYASRRAAKGALKPGQHTIIVGERRNSERAADVWLLSVKVYRVNVARVEQPTFTASVEAL